MRPLTESAKVSTISARSRYRIVAGCRPPSPAAAGPFEAVGSGLICFVSFGRLFVRDALGLALGINNPKSADGSIGFAKARVDQLCQSLDDFACLPAGRLDAERGARRRGQHHQTHNRGAADRIAVALDPHFGVEFLDRLHEFGRGARVQAFFVSDDEGTNNGAFGRWRLIGPMVGAVNRFVHLPVRTRLAMVTYLRPASWAAATASSSGHSSRTLASLTSIGRLMPASTSTLGRLMTEMARLDGVPPNMSVKIATPSPESTRRAASIMSLRRSSTSSSGPMVTASIWPCGPTTCSNAARNSIASRPWVTSTRPIMKLPAGASRLHRTKGCSS